MKPCWAIASVPWDMAKMAAGDTTACSTPVQSDELRAGARQFEPVFHDGLGDAEARGKSLIASPFIDESVIPESPTGPQTYSIFASTAYRKQAAEWLFSSGKIHLLTLSESSR